MIAEFRARFGSSMVWMFADHGGSFSEEDKSGKNGGG